MPINNAGNRVSQAGAPLDVYKENVSWTPIIFGTTVPGSGTYTTQAGYYSQIGTLVYVTAKVVWTAHTGRGDLRMSLPIGVRGNLTNYQPIGTFASQNVNFPGGNNFLVSFFLPGTSTVDPRVIRDNNAYNDIRMQPNGEIIYGGWYLI